MLKDAYIHLRRLGFPDRDIFIYPQGEFNEFKGEVLGQQPEPGDMISSGNRITLIVAMPGICDAMPDLYTDHSEDFFTEDFNDRTGTRRFFSIFDSALLKMICRLEWIRDIYAGAHYSAGLGDYMGSIFSIPKKELQEIDPEILGFLLPRLYRYLGIEGAMSVLIETLVGIKTSILLGNDQNFLLPQNVGGQLGKKWRLGMDMYLGERFKGENPALNIQLEIDDCESVPEIIPGSEGHRLLREILNIMLPYYAEQYRIVIKPDKTNMHFENDASHLGYSTVLSSHQDKRN